MKISVVVPVYNSEKYVNRCIDSVKAQTYTDWELILIDDGSEDSSAAIIDEAAAQDERIVAIHQANVGAGEARNRGIDMSTGDYIVFLDSDDYIDKDYFSLLIPKAEQNDVVFIDVDQVTESGQKIRSESMSIYKSYDKDRFLRSQMTGKIYWGGGRKAASLRLIHAYNIRYTNHKIGEEALYSFQLLSVAEKIGFLDEKPVYFYVNREDSLSRSRDIDPWGDVAEVLAEHIKTLGMYNEYANTLNAFRVTALVVSIDRISRYYNGDKRRKELKKCMEQFKVIYDTDGGIDLNSMSNKAKLFTPFVVKGIIFPVVWASKVRQIIRNCVRK